MNPLRNIGTNGRVLPARWQRTLNLCTLAVCLTLLVGCSSTKSLVKKGTGQPTKSRPAVAKVEKKSTNKKDSGSKSESFPALPLHEEGPRFRRFLRHYAYKQRPTMKRYLERAGRYLPMVQTVVLENGMPVDLSYLFMLESGANPGARSPANALGMWQFMPATARSYGMRVDSWVDERLDPQRSTEAAMLYLKDLFGMFGCWRLALSAYNSGENRLNRVLCQEDADEYGEICSSKRLNKETREFWPRYQAIAQIAKNPAKYGFSRIESRKTAENYEYVTVSGSYSLATLAAAMEMPADLLAALNPAILRGMTPPRGEGYLLRVPPGKKQLLMRALERIRPERPRRHILHVVHRGDNLSRILQRYKVTKSQLAMLNPDVNLRRGLKRGAKLVVPVSHKSGRSSSGVGRRVSMLR
jgi:peptidoglycan lytic transglycosylase D